MGLVLASGLINLYPRLRKSQSAMKEKVNLLRISEMKNLMTQGKAQDGIKPDNLK